MRIGIDISQTAYTGTGVARFTTGLVEASLSSSKSGDEWVYFYSGFRNKIQGALADEIKKNNHQLVTLPLPPKLLSYIWNDLHICQIESFTGKLDWFISSDWTEPPSSCKKATIVHDMVFRKYPDTVDRSILSTHSKRLKHVERESALIFCDSMATQNDLIEEYNIDSQRTFVNYPGVTVTKPSSDDITRVKQKYNLNKPFILSVGKLEPRKNLNRLIEAFSGIHEEIELLIVGPTGWESLNNSKIDNPLIRMLGYVPDSDLFALYSAALFFIFPSLYEGFGYPAIEAMMLDCPTALSRTSSLIELGADAALFFDPTKIEDMRNVMKQMIADPNIRESCKQKGRMHAASFTWDRYYSIMQEAFINHG